MGRANQNIIKLDRQKWSTPDNYKQLLEIGFIELNPAYNPSVEWTGERQKSGDQRVIRAL